MKVHDMKKCSKKQMNEKIIKPWVKECEKKSRENIQKDMMKRSIKKMKEKYSLIYGEKIDKKWRKII